MDPQILDGLRIMVVDDEPELLEVIASSLEMFGAQVVSASSGKKAASLLKSEAIDIIISDVRMPDGDGIFLLGETRNLNAKRPAFFFLSGFSDLSMEDALGRGAQGMFYKPIGIGALATSILSVLAKD